VLLHALVILLILGPVVGHDVALVATRDGLGPGPRGGGGGGERGAGGRPREEKVQFVRATAQPVAQPLTPPVPPKTVIPPPPPPTIPTFAKVDIKLDAPAPPVLNNLGDGSAVGAGPGTGGGTGTGNGTGRGSGEGPGTGGGGVGDTALAKNYFAVLPLESHPRNLDGKQITVRFAIDEKGVIQRVEFASTGDRSFDRKLREKMMEWKFRPAFLRSSGVPVASVYETQIGF
jgi:protein TonB